MLPAVSRAGRKRADRRVLADDRRTDEQRILDLLYRLEEVFGQDQVADAPARHAVRFGERVERDRVAGAVGEGARREVARAVVGEVLVRLVGDVVEAVPTAEGVDFAQGRLWVNGAGRVVGRDGHDGARARRDSGGDGIRLQLVARIR